MTAATATELLNEGVTDTAALSQAVPALPYTVGGNAATPFIRGVGTTVNSVGNEASVATYVDASKAVTSRGRCRRRRNVACQLSIAHPLKGAPYTVGKRDQQVIESTARIAIDLCNYR